MCNSTNCLADGLSSSGGAEVGNFLATSDGGGPGPPMTSHGALRTLTTSRARRPASVTRSPMAARKVSSLSPRTTAVSSWNASGWPSGIRGMTAIDCPSTTTCYALGETTSQSSVLVVTTDSGSIWSTESLPSGASRGLQCPSTTTCYGYGSSGSGGAIVSTTNGGMTWTTDTLPSGSGTSTGSCAHQRRSVTWGTDISTDGWVMIKTTDGGSTWNIQTLPSDI